MRPSAFAPPAVAIVRLREPPPAPPGGYAGYKDWLLAHFHDHLCSYCLLHSRFLQVDHYEPRSFKPDLVDDPHNLLLSCPSCGGPSGKWDYHPEYAKRRRLARDRTCHLVLDVRRMDLAELYQIDPEGNLVARPGPHEDLAKWNIALLHLDLWPKARKECLEALDLAEWSIREPDVLPAYLREAVIGAVAERLPFFAVFGIELSTELAAALPGRGAS
jgi:hypothetical protein